ncbi:phosphodiester glycosidase family protein [Paenibacillus lutrae]|uniref:Metallophosphoesterase n=1 Tax=Paenibacillus lutrae TaxID=2078573 RepID=A0A7X3JYC4_9BACL|nr:phosphodiester glycosidase family protein [Paenibacillus lutrae]MVO98809.1 metallophosphoesterase [Paenibacillus lutrae]
MVKNKKILPSLLSGVLLFSLLLPAGQGLAAASGPSSLGNVVDKREMEIGPGATYSWMNMKLDRGSQQMHFVEFDPKNAALGLQPGLTDGKVYGMQGVSKMAADADKEGNRVIAAVNGDFYDMSTGVPMGMFMGDGEILSSPPDGWFAFGMKKDGSSLYGQSPKLTRTLTVAGKTSPVSAINRMRAAEGLNLYTAAFHTSTMTNDLGDEIVLDVLDGEVKSGRTLKLKVSAIHKDKGNTPLAAGQVVLSASGKHRDALAGLAVGDEVTADFAFEGEWKDVTMSIGGSALLVKDGVAQPNSDPAAHPRTAIGTKADGSVIMLELDGRQPGFSEGVTLQELGVIMKDLGAVNALNLDGGGSSTFVARLPGEKTRKMLNSPSDGGERKTANGILLVNKAPEGAADKLVVQPQQERVLAGSKAAFKAAAVDANLHPAALSGDVQWSIDPALGSIAADGTFTAGRVDGTAEIKAAAGSLSGTGSVEVVTELTELKFPGEVATVASGASQTMKVTAIRDGKVIQADNSQLQWRVEGPVGTIDASGVFTAANVQEKNGKIFATYKNVETSIDVTVGLPPVILEDFENGLDRYKPSSGAQAKSTKVSIETDEDLVRFGKSSLKLEYDFTGMPGTSGAYLQTTGTDKNIEIPGYPEKISMWVYGDGKKHWLRAQLRDSKGAIPLDFVDQTVGVDFTGWKYLEAAVPKGRTLPLTIDMPVRYMETKAANKDAGAIYIDGIRAIYGPVQDDMDPPVLKKLAPAENAVIQTNTPVITAYGEDAGYDPVKHPGTTLIDPDKIRFYLDGSLVPHTLYPPEGKIYYTPGVPLADGIHQAKISIKDLSGNQTTKEWTFNVNTGSSKIVYDTPEKVYAGGTYTVDLKAVKAADIKKGQVEFAFDPSKVENVKLIRGGKLSEAQMTADIDGSKGTVKITMQELSSALLTDGDLFGQIQYQVKKDATGTNAISFKSGSVSFVSKGDTSFTFFGLPLSSEIKNHFQLGWNEEGMIQGYSTELTVKDESGAAVAGAQILADGAEVGVTDASGVLKTDQLTSALKTYNLQAVKGDFLSAVVVFKVSPLSGSAAPHNISVGMGADPAVSRSFQWHTNPGTQPTVVEIVKESEFTDFAAGNVKEITGDSYLYHTLDLGSVRVHKAVADGLLPGTGYVYRVGDGQGNYSGQGKFRTTEASGDASKFLYFADSQASDAAGFKLWGNTIKKAASENPDAEFMLHAGDMVDKGFNEKEWNLWFSEAQAELMKTTLVSVIGNHEVMGNKENGDFLAHFNQPGNGLDSLKGSNFSIDYKDMHFVVLNSEYQYEEQAQWLRKDLAQTDKKWKVVAFHRGPYGSIYDEKIVRDTWTPVFDEFKVDLVLNGHDHIYSRTFPMKGNKPALEGEGTTYVIAGSTGPKFYSRTVREWQKVIDEEQTQMYAAVEIAGDQLQVVTKTVGGRVVDEFTLSKNVVPPGSVEIEPKSALLAVGESIALTAAVKPDNASDKSVTWSVQSSTPDGAAAVSADGVVTARKLGTAVIRATSKASPNVYADVTVEVNRIPQGKIESVTLAGLPSLLVGDTDKTVTKGVYTDGTAVLLLENVAYDSSDKKVATIGATGRINALAEGRTVISATYGGHSAQYDLTVLSKDSPLPVLERITLDGLRSEMEQGQTAQAAVTGTYSDQSSTLLTEGVRYTSSEPSVAPVNANGQVRAVREGQTVITATYGGKSAQFDIRVKASGGSGGSDGGSGNGGGSGGNPPVQPPVTPEEPKPDTTGRIEISASELADKIAGGGAAALHTSAALQELTLPGNAAELLQGKPVSITSAGLAVTIPADVLSELSALVPAGERAGSTITLSVSKLAAAQAQALLNSAERAAGAELAAAGDLLAFRLTVTTKDGKTSELSAFGKPITLEFAVLPAADRDLSGLYHIADSGKLEYVGGTWQDGKLTAQVRHFSTYAVLEYSKSFADVPENHWAARVIQVLAAKGLIDGVSGDQFAPGQKVTRAEFAAMLVRLLGLQAQGAAPFADVPAQQWYAGAVAAAAEAGLVSGVSATEFAPDAAIKRQEMAAMIVRAYRHASAQRSGTGADAGGAGFADVETAPAWAKEAIASAYSLGLVDGRTDSLFQPQGVTTRAESAQVIFKLMNKLAE